MQWPIKILLISGLIISALPTGALALEMTSGSAEWMITIDGGMYGSCYGLALDGNGYLYACGDLDLGSADFDPGDGEEIVDGGAYLVKYTTDGDFEWATSWPGSANDVAVDSGGSVYVVGSRTLDPEYISIENHGMNTEEIYIMKFDSDGNALWELTWESIYPETAYHVITDTNDDILVAGKYINDWDMDPSEGRDDHEWMGGYDCYVMKIDSDSNYLWGTTWGGDEFDEVGGLFVDTGNNIHAVGICSNEVSISGSDEVIRCDESGSMYLLELTEDGVLDGFRVFSENSLSDGDVMPSAVVVDMNGNTVIAGDYFGAVDLDPGTSSSWTESTSSYRDSFVLCLDGEGNHAWDESFFTDSCYITSAGFISGMICLVGHYKYSENVGNEISIPVGESSGPGPDCLLMTVSMDGTIEDVFTWGSGGWDYAWDMVVDGNGAVYVAGDSHGENEGNRTDQIYILKIHVTE